MKKLILFVFASMLWLAGCPQAITPLKTDVACGGAHNEGDPAYCGTYTAEKPILFITTANAATAPSQVVDIGSIARSKMVIGEGVVDNPVASDFFGYAEFKIIDGGCNGATSWDLMPKQAVSVAPNTTRDVVGVGGQCGDMPLGAHTAIATVWDADGVTIIGQYTINFVVTP